VPGDLPQRRRYGLKLKMIKTIIIIITMSISNFQYYCFYSTPLLLPDRALEQWFCSEVVQRVHDGIPQLGPQLNENSYFKRIPGLI